MQLTINLREVQDVTCLDLCGKILLGPETDALQEQIKQLLASSKCEAQKTLGQSTCARSGRG